MRNTFVALMASLISCSAATAFWPEAAESSFEIGAAWRCDKLDWEIEADTILRRPLGGFPRDTRVEVGSELEWKNLHIWQVDAKLKYVTCDNIYIRAYADYGWIRDGKVTDKDFIRELAPDGRERSEEFDLFNAHCKGDNGHVYDASIGLGYQFWMCDDSFALTPIIGYSWHGQHLEIKDPDFSSAGPFFDNFFDGSSSHHLHSKYRTRWYGPWLGLDLDYRFCCDWTLFATYEYHWARYNASADWNLRHDDLLDGFKHHAKHAHGQIASIGVKWDFCECWTLGLTGQWQWWRANSGTDRALIREVDRGEDIEFKCFLYTPLKHVTWNSASISLDVGMVF